jgi:putative spermidine/putrescine transport system substrate-binding protein
MEFDRRFVLRAGAGLVALASTGRRVLAEPDALPAGLEAAARQEAKLNVVAFSRDWANFGWLMDTYSTRYGIRVDDANEEGSSAEELQAVRSLKRTSREPDVLDLGPAFAAVGAQEGLFQPYKVTTWAEIPDDAKDPGGRWAGDYFGTIAFAVNTDAVKVVPRGWADLKQPAYRGMIALNGNPAGASAAFSAVFAAALANGGSYDDIMPGIDFFGALAKSGNYVPAAATGPAMLVGGQAPIVINWDYLSLGYKKTAEAQGKARISVTLPEGSPPFGSFYCAAISAFAPHPSAARLWLEFLYSDQGQLGLLAGFAHPIRFRALVAAGKVPEDLLKALPPADAYKAVTFATPAQTDKAKQVLAENWSRVVRF